MAFIFWKNMFKLGRDCVHLNPHLLTLKVNFTFTLPYKTPVI